jgi:hypothetical protein
LKTDSDFSITSASPAYDGGAVLAAGVVWARSAAEAQHNVKARRTGESQRVAERKLSVSIFDLREIRRQDSTACVASAFCAVAAHRGVWRIVHSTVERKPAGPAKID